MSYELVQGMSVFVRVAELKSFTAAGTRLGLSPSAVSKAISRLEERVGARLLYRNTRRVSLTDEGTAFLEHSREILGELESIEASVTGRLAVLRGRLRIHMPTAFGRRVVMPLLHRFYELHKELTIDVELSDRTPDLAEEGIDASIRSGKLPDSSLVARRLCNLEYVFVASPAYIRRNGLPRSPKELETHNCLGFYTPYTHRYRDWCFAPGSGRVVRAVSGRLNVNNADALVDAAIEGMGIARIATFLAASAIKNGTLCTVLDDYAIQGPSVWVVYRKPQFGTPRAMVFVEFLCDAFARQFNRGSLSKI